MNVNMKQFYELSDFSLFSGCRNDYLEEMLAAASCRLSSYHSGDIIALQDSVCRSLLLLAEGTVSARMTNPDGKEITIENLSAAEILAPAFIFGSENTFPVTILANSECHIWTLSKDNLLEIMQKDSIILRNFLRIISDRSLFLSRKLNEFALQSLSSRFLSYLKKHKRISNVQEVSEILGVARPSLSRVIALLLERGEIMKEEQGYIIVE